MAQKNVFFHSKCGKCHPYLLGMALIQFDAVDSQNFAQKTVLGVYNFDLQPGELHVYDHCAKVIGWGRQRRPNAVGMQQYLIAVNSWSAMWAKDGE